METGCNHSVCGGCSYYLCLVEAEIWRQIGPTGTDKLDTEVFSIDTTGLPTTCMYVSVGNCLVVVVKRKGWHCNFSVHVEFLVETGWRLRRLELQTWNWYYSSHACKLANTPMQLTPRYMYLSTFDEFHRVTASDGHKFIDCIQILCGLPATLQEINLAEGGWW